MAATRVTIRDQAESQNYDAITDVFNLVRSGGDDVFFFNDFSDNFRARFRGNTLTLRNDDGQLVRINMIRPERGGTLTETLKFLDGDLTLTLSVSARGKVSVKLGSQKIGGKFADVTAEASGDGSGEHFGGSASNNNAPVGQATAFLPDGSEGATYTIHTSDLLVGFTDADGDTLSVSNLSANHGSLTPNQNGSFSFVPDAGFSGTVSLRYNVTDGKGGSILASQSFDVNPAAANGVPTGQPTAFLPDGKVNADHTINASDLLAGFSDPDGDTLSVSGLTAEHGTLTPNQDGTFTFTPEAGFVGDVNLRYFVTDGKGGSVAATQGFSVVNDAPTGSATAVLPDGVQNQPYTIQAADLLLGFTDPNGHTLAVKDLTASHGTIVDNHDGTWTFTPDLNYAGAVNLSYSVVDSLGDGVAASLAFNFAAGVVQLTSGTDILSGNAFVADVGTLQSVDKLTGTGTGAALTASLDSSTVVSPTLQNITTLNLEFAGASGLDLHNADSVSSISVNGVSSSSGSQIALVNLTTALADLAINVNGSSSQQFSVVFQDGVLGSGADSLNLSLANASAAALNLGNAALTEGYETIVLDATGANTIRSLNAGDLKQLTLTGAGDLTAANLTPLTEFIQFNPGTFNAGDGTGLASIDASAATGTLNLDLTNVVGGHVDPAGASTITYASVVGGSGDDTFWTASDLTGTSASARDSLNGGAGQNTLRLYANVGGNAAISNIQNLEVRAADRAVDLDAFDSSLGQVVLRDDASSGSTFTLLSVPTALAGNGNIILHQGTSGQGPATLNLSLKSASGAGDTAAVTLEDDANLDSGFAVFLNVRSDVAGETVENVTIHDSDSENNTVDFLSVADHTGTITLDGGRAGDIFVLGSAGNGGLVAATVTASAQLSDVGVFVGSADQNITLGAGDDTVVFAGAGNLDGNDSVTGGAGIDRVFASFAGTPGTALNFANLAVENLYFAATADTTLDVTAAAAPGVPDATTGVASGIAVMSDLAALATVGAGGVPTAAGTLTLDGSNWSNLNYAGDTTLGGSQSFNAVTLSDNAAAALAVHINSSLDTAGAGASAYSLGELTVKGSTSSLNIEVSQEAAGGANTNFAGIDLLDDANGKNLAITVAAAGSVNLGTLSSTDASGAAVNDSLATLDASGVGGVFTALVTNLGDGAQVTLGDGGSVLNTAGSAGNQITITGGSGLDIITSGSNADTISVGDGGSTINDLGGTNTITAAEGFDQVTTGDGNDNISVGNGGSSINAGGGANQITAGSGSDTVLTGDGDDTISVGDGGSSITDLGGNNTITAAEGFDQVTTADGNDTISVGNGGSVIAAGNGNNTITSGSGDDSILIGDGNDTVVATGAGADRVVAGGGNDTITDLGADDDSVVFTGTGNLDGNDSVGGGAGTDSLFASFDGTPAVAVNFANLAVEHLYFAATADTTLDVTGAAAPGVPDATTGEASGIAVMSDLAALASVGAGGVPTAASTLTLDGSNWSNLNYAGDTTLGGSQTFNAVTLSNNAAAALAVHINSGLAPGAGASAYTTGELTVKGSTTSLNIQVSQEAAGGADTNFAGIDLLDDADGKTLAITVAAAGSVNLGTLSSTAASGAAVNDSLATLNASGVGGVFTALVTNLGDNAQVTLGDGGSVLNTAGSSGNQITITGGTGLDVITSGSNADTINVGDGGSTINDLGGNNSITAAEGFDQVTSGDGDDTINVGNGGSVINAGGGTNQVTAGTGADVVTAGSGNDIIDVGNGGSTITDQGGNNQITAGTGADTVTTGTGNDTITVGDGGSTITDLGGTNTITAAEGFDQVTTGDGDDSIDVGNGGSLISTGGGTNFVTAGSGADTVLLGNGINTVVTTGAGDDRVVAGSGTDTISDLGEGDDVVVFTGAGNLDGNDSVSGGAGTDTVFAVFNGPQSLPVDFTRLDVENFFTGATADLSLDLTGAPQPGAPDVVTAEVTGVAFISDQAAANTVGVDGLPSPAATVTVSNQTAWQNLNFVGDNSVGAGQAFNGVTLSDNTSTSLAVNVNSSLAAGTGAASYTLGELTIHGATTNLSINIEQEAAGASTVFQGIDLLDDADSKTLTVAVAAAGSVTLGALFSTDASNAAVTDSLTSLDASGVGGVFTAVVSNLGNNAQVTLGDGGSVLDTSGSGGNGVTITAGAGLDLITTGDLSDIITVNAGGSVINAGNGDNQVTATAGFDTVTTGSGNDTINVGSGGSTINAGDGDNTVTGGDGSDDVTVGDGNDTVTTGAGNDVVRAGAGNDSFDLGEGDDTLIFTGSGNLDGNDILNGGAGSDIVFASFDGNPAGTAIAFTGFERVLLGATANSAVDLSLAPVPGIPATSTGRANGVAFMSSLVAGTTVGADGLPSTAATLTVSNTTAWDNLNFVGDNSFATAQVFNGVKLADNSRSRLTVDISSSQAVGTGASSYSLGQLTVNGATTEVDINVRNEALGAATAFTGVDLWQTANAALTIHVTASGSVDLGTVSTTDDTATVIHNSLQSLNAASVAGLFAAQLTNLANNAQVVLGNGGSAIDTTGSTGNNVSITAGSGFDAVISAGNDDVINVGAGGSLITDTGGNNTITATEGFDTVNTGDGNDTIDVGNGGSVITDTGGNNTITAGAGTDVVTTGDGADTIDVGDGDSVINAGGGDNVIVALAGFDTVTTGSGADQINVGDGGSAINAGDGANVIVAGTGFDTVVTGSGDDSITVGGGGSNISTGDGNNTVVAGSGSDTVQTGAGNDTVSTGADNDLVTALGGNDFIDMGDGDDRLIFTGTGNLDGNDDLDGGLGTDSVFASFNGDPVSTPTFTGFERIRLAATANTSVGLGADATNNPGAVDAVTGDATGVAFLSNFAALGTVGDTGVPSAATTITVSDQSNWSNLNFVGDNSVGSSQVFNAVTLSDNTATALTVNINSSQVPAGGATAYTLGKLSVHGSTTSLDIRVAQEAAGAVTTFQDIDFFESAGGNLTEVAITAAGSVDLGTLDSSNGNKTLQALDSSAVVGSFTATVDNLADGATVTLGNGNNVLDTTGSAGLVNVTAGTGTDVISTGAGDDVIDVGAGGSTVDAGEGNNQVTAGAGADTVNTGAGDDIINVGAGGSVIFAGGGNNTITAAEGFDTVIVGNGNNTIDVGNGGSTITAGTGSNIITAGDGVDTITVSGNGSGFNVISTGAGNDNITVSGGGVGDKITAGTGADRIVITGESVAATDTIVINAGDSLPSGADTVVGFDVVSAGTAKDLLDLASTSVASALVTTSFAAPSNGNLIYNATLTGGIVTFDLAGTPINVGTATDGSELSLTDIASFLASNLTGTDTAAFAFDVNGNGTVDPLIDSTFVFQHDDAGANTLVQLVGVTGVTGFDTDPNTATSNHVMIG